MRVQNKLMNRVRVCGYIVRNKLNEMGDHFAKRKQNLFFQKT